MARTESPKFEETSRPWFGPRARARTFLESRPAKLLAPHAALDELAKHLGHLSPYLEFVRFINYVDRESKFHYTIAICWTTNNNEIRDFLYDNAEQIVEATGWYVLPQGSRLNSLNKSRAVPRGMTWSNLPQLSGGLSSFEAAVRPEDGCSIRIYTDENESFLLDSGLPGRIASEPSDKFVLITHSHADHTGGFTTRLKGSLPAVMSVGTARLLLSGKWISEKDIQEMIVFSNATNYVPLGKKIEAKHFLVPHLPGAIGWIVRDDKSALIFTGDVSIRTDRHSFIDPLNSLIREQHPRKSFLMLDGTMAGRVGGASLANPGDDLLKSAQDDIVVWADSGEHLLYAYLDIFSRVQHSDLRHSSAFMVSKSARPLFEIVHDAFIRRSIKELDPFLASQYASGMSAWGESRWLFWTEDQPIDLPNMRRIWFLTTHEIEKGLGPEKCEFVHLGREDNNFSTMRPEGWIRLESVDTTPWTLHSNEASIIDAVAALSSEKNQIVLFHNFSNRLRKFIEKNELQALPLSGKIDFLPSEPPSHV